MITKIPVSAGTHEAIASSDGRYGYVSDYGGRDTLSVADLVNGKALPAIDLGPLRGPHGLAYAAGVEALAMEMNNLAEWASDHRHFALWRSGVKQFKLGLNGELAAALTRFMDGTSQTPDPAIVSWFRRNWEKDLQQTTPTALLKRWAHELAAHILPEGKQRRQTVFGRNFRVVRRACGWSQDEMAEICKVSKTTISQNEIDPLRNPYGRNMTIFLEAFSHELGCRITADDLNREGLDWTTLPPLGAPKSE